MLRWSYFAIVILLATSADVPRGSALRTSPIDPPAAYTLPTLSDIFLSAMGRDQSKQTPLEMQARLEIVRFVDGEFARAVRPLPADKKGFRYQARAPFNDGPLKQDISSHGLAANAGDTVQITDVIFRETEIVVEINGGARRHGRLLDHLKVGVSGGGQGAGTPNSAPQQPVGQQPAGGQRPPGATLILDYGSTLPDMSPDDLKHDLSAFLNFSNQQSAAVNWVETLPPEFKDAIKDRRAVVGMNQDMVLAALGHPDKKVRQTNDQGDETEDWIYGNPPAKTIFVTFLNDKVTQVKQYP
jgi:hypothetical protein